MTLSRLIARGYGKMPRARLEIEGHPVQPVTHRSLEQTLADGRQRLDGLRLNGVRVGARLDLAEGSIEGDGFTARINDAKHGQPLIRGFRLGPSLRTFLAGSHSRSATTLNVFSTSGWPSSGVIHVGTEVILYTGTTSSTFTGCTRGAWGTIAQAHQAADGANLSYPHATDRPISIEGRRAVLYLYGEGDDPQGDGTARWRGVVATDASFRGREITFQVDPPTAILRQQLGGDTTQPLPISGIYYPWNAPFRLVLTRSVGAPVGSPASADFAVVRVTGRYASQVEFCDELTSRIATGIAGWTWGAGNSIVAQPIEGGFQLVYRTGATPYDVDVSPTIDNVPGVLEAPVSEFWYSAAGGTSIAANSTYTFDFVAPVPRAYVGLHSPQMGLDFGRPAEFRFTEPDDASTWPANRIYLGGLAPLSTSLFLGLEGGEAYWSVLAVSTSARYVELGVRVVGAEEEWPLAGALGPNALFRVGRRFTTGNIGDLMQWLWANSPDLCNSGVCPLLTILDVAITGDEVRAASLTQVTERRLFAAFGQPVSLEDLLISHLATAGLHPSLTTGGTITARQTRLAASTELGVAQLTGKRAVPGSKVGGPIPNVDQSGWGHLSDVRYSTGYNPIEDEFMGPTVHARNVQATAPLRSARSKKLEQKSLSERYGGAGAALFAVADGTLVELSPEELDRIAEPWLGLLGDAYDLITLEVPATAFDVALGDVVKITHPMIPSRVTGAGVEGQVGILVGFEWELATMRGVLTILSHARNVAGYAPGFRVASWANVSGNQWDLTLDDSPYLVSGQELADWIAVGFEMVVVERDSAAPTTVVGTVDSVSGDVVRITFSGLWTPAGGTGEWDLELKYADNYDIADAESRFVFVGGPDGVAHSDGTVPHRVFGP